MKFEIEELNWLLENDDGKSVYLCVCICKLLPQLSGASDDACISDSR